MASTASAELTIRFLTTMTPDTTTGITGDQHGDVEQTDRWTQGTGSSQVDRAYKRVRTIGIGATDSYNLLAAGSLEDIIGQAIDADEAKALVVLCTDGEIKVTGAAANGLGCFTAASEGNALSEGQFVAIGLGKAGLDVTVNSKFDITETSGTATAAYTLGLIVAQ